MRLVIDALARLFFLRQRFELDHGEIAARREAAVLVQHIGNAAGHTGSKVAAGAAEHHHDAAGHVFAAMVPGALDHGDGTGIAHGKPLAGNAAEIAFAFDRTVEHCIADDDRLLRHDAGVGSRARDEPATRESLADVIVGVSLEFEGHPAREPSSEALPRGTGELHPDRIVGQPFVRISLGDLARKHSPDRAVGILDGAFDPHRLTPIERSCGLAARNCKSPRRAALPASRTAWKSRGRWLSSAR